MIKRFYSLIQLFWFLKYIKSEKRYEILKYKDMENCNFKEREMKEILSVLISEIHSLKECISNSKMLYTNKEMQDILQVNDKTLRKYRNDGLLGYSQVRDKIYYTPKDLNEFLSKNHMSAHYYS